MEYLWAKQSHDARESPRMETTDNLTVAVNNLFKAVIAYLVSRKEKEEFTAYWYELGNTYLETATAFLEKEEKTVAVPVVNPPSIPKEGERDWSDTHLPTEGDSPSLPIPSLWQVVAEDTDETTQHSLSLRTLALHLGKSLALPKKESNRLVLLALFHDVGKIAIPYSLLFKPGPLSAKEMEIMQKHPEIGYYIAQATPELAPVAREILTHHERWDGTGYPLGLQAEKIPLLARILAIVDAYDVMTRGRIYKEAISKEAALVEIEKNSGSQFDPALVKIFLQMCDKGGRSFEWDCPGTFCRKGYVLQILSPCLLAHISLLLIANP